MSRQLISLLLLACASAFGCGEDEPGGAMADGGADAAVSSGPLLPWQQGNRWTYKITGDGEESSKETTIGALEPIRGTGPNAGKMAFRVETKKGSEDQTISWQAVEGERVVRYREQAYGAKTKQVELEEHWEPSKLHIDWSADHTKAGVSWVEEYKETKTEAGMPAETKTTRDVWKVDGVDQTVTVPAGTFKAIIFVKSGGASQKTYWYVPGVGKVKETGGQTEELVSYQVQP